VDQFDADERRRLAEALEAAEIEARRARFEVEIAERNLQALRRLAGLPVAPAAAPVAPLAAPQSAAPVAPLPSLVAPLAAPADAATWLRAALAEGPLEARALRLRAEAAGLAWRSVQRAAQRIGVAVERSGFGATSSTAWWLAAAGATVADDTDTEARRP
jgi:hypothetical protein